MRVEPTWRTRVVAGMCFLGAIGCQPQVQDGQEALFWKVQGEPSYAQGFAWLQTPSGETILGLRQPRTGRWLATVSHGLLMPQEGRPSEWINVPHVTIDSSKGFVTTSTTHVHLIQAGAGLEGWKGCTSLSYLRDSVALKWAESTSVLNLQGDGGWNAELVAKAGPGWIAVSPSHDLQERGWPLVPVTEYLEPSPLGRAEWMIPLAWMAGDSAAGAHAFFEVDSAYASLKSALPRSGMRVFTGSVADGLWHAPGNDSFVAQWIRDAGGEYALPETNAEQNVQLSMESMLELANQTDAWVVVTFDPDTFTVNDLVSKDPRHESLMEAAGEVWACNTAKVDYFGELVCHPEWILEDLSQLMAGNDHGPHGVFRRLQSNLQKP